MRILLIFNLAATFVLPLPAMAIPAITCHCFTERRYDPARPALADPYFLATTANSFFSAAFAVEKKIIVDKKQQGISADDLWIAYWLAARSGANPDNLLDQRRINGSWRQVAAPLAVPVTSLGRRVAAALNSSAADERLARAVVDELLLRFRFHTEKDLAALRNAGAGNQELVIAALLAAKTGQPALLLYRQVKAGRITWGALLQQARIEPADIQPELNALIKSAANHKALP